MRYNLTAAAITMWIVLAFAPCMTYSQPPELSWSEDQTRCWYRAKSKPGQNEFWIVDTNSNSKILAFDTEEIESQIHDLDPSESSKIRSIDFGVSENLIIVRSPTGQFLLDKQTGLLRRTNLPRPTTKFFSNPPASANGHETTIYIHNRTASGIELFWINSNGDKVAYGVLKPGDSREQHTFVGHVWLIEASGGEKGYFSATADAAVHVKDNFLKSIQRPALDFDPRRRYRSQRPSYSPARTNGQRSPDRRFFASIKENRISIAPIEKMRETKIFGDATSGFTFSSPRDLFWSPDSNSIVAFETKNVTERKIHFIESSPQRSLHPKLKSHTYPKPGDRLPIKRLRLFDVVNGIEIEVEHTLFDNPFSIRLVGWSGDSKRFWLVYNQRGHQALRLLEIDASSGTVRIVVEELTDTFIHYSDPGKSLLEYLPDEQFLWASERSGWNHIYRYSSKSGNLINQVTTGDWNFHRLDHIDYEQKQIWFFAYGVAPNQDPYHRHFCRVNFDGSGFKLLTAGDGTHEIKFAQTGRHFTDSYSRVDLAPVVELRDCQSGQLIAELSRNDTIQSFGKRRLTERFVAKGRDGVSDIWGIIHWPLGFNPDKKYPVVENIYAGPHNFHVPKRFRRHYYHQHQIADAGMIVVQIDGMGTAWRSRSFHEICYKNLRDAGFPDRIAWIKAAAKTFPQIDLERVGIYGGSAGGQNAMAALLWHADFYDVAVADCGCHDNRMDKLWWNEQWMGWPVDESYIQNSNMENAQRLKGKLMLTLGELDRNVDPASTTQVVRKLIKHDKEFEFVLVAGAGHGAGDLPWAAKRRLEFLRKHLIAE